MVGPVPEGQKGSIGLGNRGVNRLNQALAAHP